MVFEENADFSLPTFPSKMIYFLTLDNDVVYIGKTCIGISRPFSHRDKEFNGMKLIYVEDEDIDLLEGEYIAKYKPKYNRVVTGYYNLKRVRERIRSVLNKPHLTMPIVNKYIKELGIQTIHFNGIVYLHPNELKRLEEGVLNNR